ncbi:TerB family tellurite resistance protein [Flavobacterium sp. RHBU_24]|uniref:TerB family tellurite resistance protein n=1 Tax=Flavobacterium sp. RHBU_24 TaxID=3391185 RepID=UPI003984AC3A
MRWMVYIMLVASLLAPLQKAGAQGQELRQLALNIEKLSQFRSILKDMKKGYEILTKGYNTVKDLTEGNFSLHKTFLDNLLQVSPSVRNYKRVADIIGCQVDLMKELNTHRVRLSGSGLFNSLEISYFNRVYENLVANSLKDLDELTAVLTAGELRMSDEERLQVIDRIYASVQDKLMFLRDFNADTSILALQRAKETNDIKAIRLLNGINP